MRVSGGAPPSQDDLVLGKRISIRGATGSGKTTVARRLGQVLGLPVIEMDALFWQPTWQETAPEEFRQKLIEALRACPEGWVCDGNYQGRTGGFVLSQADTAIWLNLPWYVSFWRLLRRTLGRAWTKEPMWAGNTESWRKAFLSKESILWFSIAYRRSFERNIRKYLAQAPPNVRIYKLRTARQVEALLRAAEWTATTRSPV